MDIPIKGLTRRQRSRLIEEARWKAHRHWQEEKRNDAVLQHPRDQVCVVAPCNICLRFGFHNDYNWPYKRIFPELTGKFLRVTFRKCKKWEKETGCYTRYEDDTGYLYVCDDCDNIESCEICGRFGRTDRGSAGIASRAVGFFRYRNRGPHHYQYAHEYGDICLSCHNMVRAQMNRTYAALDGLRETRYVLKRFEELLNEKGMLA